MLKENNLLYSRERFEEYTYRVQAKVLFEDRESTLDIYTTDLDKANIAKVLTEHLNKKATFIGITHTSSREQDDRVSKMIDEWLLGEEER